MNKSYVRRFQKLTNLLTHTNLALHARNIECNTFSRRRKMPLEDIILSSLAKKGLTTALKLRNYFKQKEGVTMEMSKQGYLQQRKRVNPDVFTYLND